VGRHDTEMSEALEGAIYREIGARDFYRAIAERIANTGGREKFMQLSKDEDGHREKLTSWFETMSGAAFIPRPDKLKRTEIGGITVDERTGALAALDIAIEAEAKAETFYRERSAETESAELRALLERIADEEHGHYTLLEAERNTIRGGFYWFDMDSTSFLED
jgi:rubrerythrin